MLTESMEDYLETIYRLVKEKRYIRAVDIAGVLSVQASSVTRMIQKLSDGGYVNYEKYRNIALTSLGERYGRFLAWRDGTLERFLYLLSPDMGVKDQVEGIEHYITPVTMGLIQNLIGYFTANPDALDALGNRRSHGASRGPKDLGELRAWSFRHSMD